MVSEHRQEMILQIVKERHSVTVTELTELLGISESTARRDIVQMDKEGRLVKVYGGAVLPDDMSLSEEPTVAQKTEVYIKEKRQIARYAASMIKPHDFVYLDAGTTTGYMLDYIEESRAAFVTNAVAHAQKLAAKGMRVSLIGGMLKASTEAVVGEAAVRMIQQYHFSKGFFGANGISAGSGFTTPDEREALIKRTAVEQTGECYFLCDHSKFHMVSAVTFAPLSAGTILTDQEDTAFRGKTDIKICN